MRMNSSSSPAAIFLAVRACRYDLAQRRKSGGGRHSVLELRQFGDLPADLPFGEPQFIKLLQVKPEFGADAKPMAKPQRGIGGDRPLAVDDCGDAVDGHIDLAGEFGRRHAEFAKLDG